MSEHIETDEIRAAMLWIANQLRPIEALLGATCATLPEPSARLSRILELLAEATGTLQLGCPGGID